jgi:pimeloyl-ACP methyl ester carboxylesterase
VARPHILAFAGRHPDRVSACTIGDGAAPLTDDEVRQQVDFNVAADGLARTGQVDALRALLDEARTSILADPIAGFRAIMDTAPAADQEVMADPAWQAAFARHLRGAGARRRRMGRRGARDQRRRARRRRRCGHEQRHLVAQ